MSFAMSLKLLTAQGVPIAGYHIADGKLPFSLEKLNCRKSVVVLDNEDRAISGDEHNATERHSEYP